MARLSQETMAIIGVGIATIALGLSVAESLRDEMRADRAEARADREAIREEARADRAEARADREEARADRDAIREEARADRAEARADRDAIREEMRADRAEARADREQFEQQILRLTKGQGVLFGLIEGRSQDGGEADDAPDGAPPAE